MKRTLRLAGMVSAAALALGLAGCTSTAESVVRTRSAAPTFALAVTVNGGSQPSPEQWAVLRTTFTEMLGKRGFRLVENSTHAANIVHVNFVTSPGSPLAGSAVVLSIEQLPPAIPSGYPGMGSYGSRRVSLASFDSVLAADHTIYLAPKVEAEIPSAGATPDAAQL